MLHLTRFYSAHEWRSAALLAFGYLAAYALQASLPAGVALYPASAVALAGLFFGGLRVWPFVLLASAVASLASGTALPLLVMLPLGETVQAALGAMALRAARIDPLFRRYRDTFYLVATLVGAAFVLPGLMYIASLAVAAPLTGPAWLATYAAMLASLLIVTPFLLRWFAKPRFSRTLGELGELAAVFALLVAIDVALFVFLIDAVAGVPLLYFLAIPLFWIALRLRPRFVSLALLVTAGIAIGGTVVTTAPALLAQELYEVEAFLILIAMSFFTIVSLEEDRRVNTNIMRSQVSTLENAVARVSSESKAKNDFIAILAHELRNPLAPVVSSIDLLRIKGGRDEEDMRALDLMEERMGTVRRLLDDLLDISRISEGKVTLAREPLDLETVIRRAALSVDHHIRERHQSLVLKFPKKRTFVLADPVRIEQVFSNLLTNASKYSNPGDTVTLQMQRVDDRVEVTVTDQGIGIPARDLESIFTPFHQIEDGGTRSKKGLGIGLALVRSFVEMHEGSVRAESAGDGRGSQFIVSLPLLPEPGQRAEAKAQDEPAAAHRSGISVLVVDDNDAAAASIGRLLELRGCQVTYAYDGGQALERAKEFTPEVILLDVGLPDQDGYEVAEALRTRGFGGTLIALTGFSTEEAKTRGAAAGFDHYLVKPAGLADLRRVIPGLA